MSSLTHNPHVSKAYEWGIEDGQAGNESRAWEYYVPGSAREDAYNLGFLVGMAKRQPKRLAGGSPGRLTAAQVEEMEAERPYVPFQSVEHDATGRLCDEPGYTESLQPWTY